MIAVGRGGSRVGIFANTRWIRPRQAAYVGLRICGYICLPTYLVHRFSPVFTGRKCVPTSGLGCEASKHARLSRLGSLRYSAVLPTSGRGKGVPRRSYTHATRHRRSMARKTKRGIKNGGEKVKRKARKRERKEKRAERESRRRATTSAEASPAERPALADRARTRR